MSNDVRHLTTDEGRERFARAQTYGRLCAACGRSLGDGETVYVQQIMVDLKSFAMAGVQWSRKTIYRDAPLGAECASPTFLARTEGREPEHCAGCGRPMHYAKVRAQRQQALCSKRCSGRAVKARHMAERADG